LRKLLTTTVLMLGTSLAMASPAGLWKTIDDKTDAVTAVVRIVEDSGVLTGEILEVLDPEAAPDAICDLCTDDRKNAPIVGLTIIRNVALGSRQNGPWDGGEILDPKDGKVYKVRLKLADAGRKLEVRGYIGTPMLGRTQVWHRAD